MSPLPDPRIQPRPRITWHLLGLPRRRQDRCRGPPEIPAEVAVGLRLNPRPDRFRQVSLVVAHHVRVQQTAEARHSLQKLGEEQRCSFRPTLSAGATWCLPDANWRVEVVQQCGRTFYQLIHDGVTIQWLSIASVERILGEEGYDMSELTEAPVT